MKSRATQTKELDMVNGPLARKILIYSIPLMFSNLLQVFFNMTDVAVVGKFAGARALGSVGSTTIIITLTTGILLGMGGGVNAVTALHMGAEDYQRVHKTVHTSVILCFIAGLLLLVAGMAFSKPLLEVMNTKPELIDGATAYLMIYLCGSPALALYNFGNGVLSAVGDTKTSHIPEYLRNYQYSAQPVLCNSMQTGSDRSSHRKHHSTVHLSGSHHQVSPEDIRQLRPAHEGYSD